MSRDEVDFLSLEDVLEIAAGVMDEVAVRDPGLLAAAVARPQATFDGVDLYSDYFTKAAALMAFLVNNHPFIDDNKRVGITAAGLFLRLNSYRLSTTNATLESFTLQVAQGKLTVEEMADWFRAQSVFV